MGLRLTRGEHIGAETQLKCAFQQDGALISKRARGGSRTRNLRITNAMPETPNVGTVHDLRRTPSATTAKMTAVISEDNDPHLAQVLTSWKDLSPTVKEGVAAIVRAAAEASRR